MTEEKWLKDRLEQYRQNPQETLIEQLDSMATVTKQFLNAPTSKAALAILKNAEHCNRLFLEAIIHPQGM